MKKIVISLFLMILFILAGIFFVSAWSIPKETEGWEIKPIYNYSCFDSDYGKNIFLDGHVVYNQNNPVWFFDFCLDDFTIKEYGCRWYLNAILGVYYWYERCPQYTYCYAGACRPLVSAD